VASRRLATSHAFHSRMMAPIAERFGELVAGVALAEPEVPLVSNVTGTFALPGQVTDPAYWVRHLLEPVRFGAGLAALVTRAQLLLEVGPGQSLSAFALQGHGDGLVAVPALPSQYERRDDLVVAATALSRLWLAGAAIDWTAFYAGERRRRVALPTYPFERQRCWIERRVEAPAALATGGAVGLEAAPIATTVQGRPGLPNPYVAAVTPTEGALVAIWEELLAVSPIGVHDSFFDLGGHSLLATRLINRIRTSMGVEIGIHTLFEASSVARLAGKLAAAPKARTALRPIRQSNQLPRPSVQYDNSI